MNRFRLIANSVTYYWKAHLGVALGTLFATMALTGSLIVGDCVDHTLRATALKRLGTIQFALSNPTRLFREQLADDLQETLSTTTAPVFHVKAIARHGDGSLSVNNVNVYGVDSRFWSFGQKTFQGFDKNEESLIVNRAFADRLSVAMGDEIILRIENPSALSREVPLTTVDDSSLAFRLTVDSIAEDRQMGRFDLHANQVVPNNAFVPLKFLQDKTNQIGKINTLLLGGKEDSALMPSWVDDAIKKHWSIEDAQLDLITLPKAGWHEILTERIFIEPAASQGIVAGIQSGTGANAHTDILTYFVNEIRKGDRATPYSMVSAIGENNSNTPLYPELRGLQDNEIVINDWMANDLNAKKGDELTLTYNVPGPMRKLIEHRRVFTVRDIIPMSHPLCDPTLMPDFPGIAQSEHCRDWDPGFIIDLKKIRDKDEAYWDQYKGTPKAFVSLTAGRDMWRNRYGDLTGVRFYDASHSEAQIENNIISNLSPSDFGLVFQPVRETALKAVNHAMSFGPLFIGLSFFLIVSALILTALLFVLSAERRARQTGLLIATGFTLKRIRRLYLGEGLSISVLGSILGVIAALAYSRFMVWALSTVWSGAVAGIQFEMAYLPVTMIYGFLAGVVISTLSIWFVIRRQSKAPVISLLSTNGVEGATIIQASGKGVWLAVFGVLFAVSLYFLTSSDNAAAAAGQFFGIGALLLIAGIGLCHAYLSRLVKSEGVQNLSLFELGKRNIGRRRGRSLAVIGVLASGCFLVIAVGSNRHDALYDAESRSSGTGGFAYYCTTSLPLLYDLNTEAGCNEFGLSRNDLPKLDVYPLRLREGDDASCLNLNRPQSPRLIGIDPQRFSSRNAFSLAQTVDGDTSAESAWKLLDKSLENGMIPAIVDRSTAMWALGKSIGDTLTCTDERGQTFDVCLIGFLSNSIFQGSVLISETQFTQRYPSSGGYRIALLDIPQKERDAYRKVLSNALQDIGLDMTPAPERLAAFFEVENTYLSIFQILGGLGLLLGCAGIGVVVMRNILERHSEFALMRAIGFSTASIRKMVVTEHVYLLILGLACGTISGLIASLPAMRFHTSSFPYLSLSLTLLPIAACGLVAIYFSTVSALRENLLRSLRSE